VSLLGKGSSRPVCKKLVYVCALFASVSPLIWAAAYRSKELPSDVVLQRNRQGLRTLSDGHAAFCLSLALDPGREIWITSDRDWNAHVMSQFGFTIDALVTEYGFVRVDMSAIRSTKAEWETSNATNVDAYLLDLSPRKRLPTAILVWDSYAFDPGVVKWLRQAAPIFYFIDDLHFHNNDDKRKKMDTISNVDFVFSTYAYNFLRFYPNATYLPVKWMPHAASPDYSFEGINAHASNTALLSGAMSRYYPLRVMAAKLATKDRRIVTLQHPGYGRVNRSDEKTIIGRRFALALREHRASITSGLVFHHVIAKMFEIPASGSLLITGKSLAPQLAQLGFAEGAHYLTYEDEQTLEHALDLALSVDAIHRSRVDAMRHAAQRLVQRRHTTATRAEELARELRLWTAAWHSQENGCWSAFVADSTQPTQVPGGELSSDSPSATRFRQVALLSRGM
jgi:hypothetical protein